MESVSAWLSANWFVLIQGIGIVGGLLFGGISIRRDTKARKVSDLLALTTQHRELWAEMHTRPGLERILSPEVDLIAKPISTAEERYLNEIIIHFTTGWLLLRNGSTLVDKEGFVEDLRAFLALPLPRAVWNEGKTGRDPKFIRFVDAALTRTPRTALTQRTHPR